MTSQADGGNWERQGKGVSWIGFPCQSFRLDADLSLAQAAEKAKITPTRLRTLEEGDFAKIDLHLFSGRKLRNSRILSGRR